MTSRLSSLLVQDGLVSAKRMADAFQRQVIYGGTLDTNLLEMRVVEEDVLLAYLGRASGLPTQPAGITALGRPSPETLKAFSKELAERFRAVPCARIEGGVLRVLVADPVEPQDMESLAQNVRLRIEPWIGPEFRVTEAMDIVYGEAMPSRFQRLLTRSNQAHEQKGLPPPRVIDPVPRFGSLHEFGAEAPAGAVGRVASPVETPPTAPVPTPMAAPLLPPSNTALDLAWTEEPTSVDEAAVLEERPVSGQPAAPLPPPPPKPAAAPVSLAPRAVEPAAAPLPVPPAERAPVAMPAVVIEPVIAPKVSAPVVAPPVAPSPAPVQASAARPSAAPIESVPELIPEESAPVVPVKITPVPEAPRVTVALPPAPVALPPAPVALPPAPLAPAPAAAMAAAPAVEPHSQGGKKKKRRRGGEAPRVPPPSPIVAKPVITPPGRGEAPKVVVDPSVVREPSVVVAGLPSEVGAAPGAVPQRTTSEHTPLPLPLPPPSDLSGPLSSLVSSSHPALSGAERPVSEPVPVPIDSGRLGEQLVRGAKATTGPTAGPGRDSPRVDAAQGEPRPAPLSFEAAREIISGAEERDLIFETLCRAVRGRIAFAAVFTVHGDVAFGRCALGDGWLDRQGLGKVAVPLDRPSAFRIAVKGRSPHLGRIGDQPAAGDALGALGRKPPLSGAVLPVLVRGRTLALLYIDDDGREVRSDLLEELRPLMIEVSQAFQRLVLRSRAGGFSGGAEEGRRGQVESEMLSSSTSAWRPGDRDKRNRSTLARFSTHGGPESVPKVIEVRDDAERDADSAIPRASTEQPTTRLRPEGGKRSLFDSSPGLTPAPESRSDASEEGSSEASAQAPTDAAAESAETRPARAATPSVRLEAPEAGRVIQPAEGQAPLPTLTELVGRAAAGDERAVEQLLGEGEDAARAIVMALPGPLKSRERQALGDPIGEPVFARGALLALVPRLGQPAVQPLLERLENPVTPPEVRYYVALCFTEMPVEAAVRPLGHRLFDGDDAVRMAAVTALRSCPAGDELRDLFETLRSDLLGPDARRQQYAAEALGELRDVQAVPRLIQLLSHDDLLLASAAARALQTITKQDLGRSRWRWRMWWRRHQAEPRLQWMLSGLGHQSVAVRASAQDELRGLCGDVAGYRFDLPRREREVAQRRWAQWWQRRGYPVYPP